MRCGLVSHSRRKVAERPSGRAYRAVDIVWVRLPVADRDSHRSSPSPRGAAKEGFTGRNNARDDFIGPAIVVLIGRSRLGIDEAHQALIDRRLPNHFGTG